MNVIIKNGLLLKAHDLCSLSPAGADVIARENGFPYAELLISSLGNNKELTLDENLHISGIKEYVNIHETGQSVVSMEIDEDIHVTNTVDISKQILLLLLNRYGSIEKLCDKRNLEISNVNLLINKYGLNGRMVWS